MPEQSPDRRVSDPRIDDIQHSVHEINGTVRGLERRMDHHENRVSSIERDVIRTEESQKTLERVMDSEISRIGEKVDGVGKKFDDHLGETRKRDATVIRLLLTLVLSAGGTLAWFVLKAVMQMPVTN